jgi:two-component system chemotaxis response regulator CheB
MVELPIVRSAARRDKVESSKPENSFPIRCFSACAPTAIVIGASTGGPQALSALLTGLNPHLDGVTIFIVLHTPIDFTSVVAGQIERSTGRSTIVAGNGQLPHPGNIYFAAGGIHMSLLRLGSSVIMRHQDSAPENFCKPSVDVLFRSAATVYGSSVLAIVLTGMGSDGLAGSRELVAAGGSVIAQDEASSVVWGMPGAVAQAGLASAVLPIAGITATVSGLLKGVRPRGAA